MTKANGDIQAIVLAGPGHRLFPLIDETAASVNASGSSLSAGQGSQVASPAGASSASAGTLLSSSTTSSLSKALLPLCNHPMIHYPLNWLMQAGVGEIFIVVHQKFYSRLSNWVKQQPFDSLYASTTRVEVVPVAEYEGSLSAVLSVRHRIRGDFFVVGCDLITDAPLSRMADLHRSKSALFTCMLSGPQASGLMSNVVSGQANSNASAEVADPRYLSSLIGEELLVALDLNTLASTSTLGAGGSIGSSTSSCNLIYCQPQADALDDSTNTYLPVKMSTLCRYPRLRLRTDLLDPHCYLFSSEIYNIIDEIAGWAQTGEEDSIVQEAVQQTVPASLFSFREDFIPRLMAKFHRFHSSQLASANPPSSFAFIVDSGHYCLRANTLPALLEASRQLLKLSSPSLVGTRIAASAEIPPRSQVGSDSMFGEGSRLGERSSVKKSAVGAGCVLGSNVKIVNSVVLDGVVIEDGCKLEGCIVGPKATIREKSQLRDCDVAGGYVVEKETAAKGESFSQHRELTGNL